jgi:hypothetical protein
VKLLYLATRGEGATDLEIEREVDALSRQFAGSQIQFQPRPWMRAETLARDLSSADFDMLHITAHGEGGRLQVLDSRGHTVMLTAEHIKSFLPSIRGPRLIYVNACDSKQLVDELVRHVPFAIGSTLPIENNQAIQGALSFYWRLALGDTVEDAFRAAHGMVDMLSDQRAEIVLRERVPETAHHSRFLAQPVILAAFTGDIPRRPRNWYEILFGVEAAPSSTTQVVFFTDDPDFIDDAEEDTLASQICAVARRASESGSIWCDSTEAWDLSGDFRVYAAGVTADRTIWTTSTSLCEALCNWYCRGPDGKHPQDLDTALHTLRNFQLPKPRPKDGRRRKK